MGYVTTFSGRIDMSEEGKEKITQLWDKIKETFELYESSIEDNYICVCEAWKDYDCSMLKFCQAIALIDDKCMGQVEARGEEDEDFWRISIEFGEVKRWQGGITYRDGELFEDLNTKKIVYEMGGNDSLSKEIVINELKKENNNEETFKLGGKIYTQRW